MIALQYCVLASARHQHESATGKHMSPPSWASHPPPTPSHPLDNHFYDEPINVVVVAKSLTPVWLWDPVDCSPSGSSIQGILQERMLEWIAISFSRDLPDPGIQPGSLALKADSLPSELPISVVLATKSRSPVQPL